MTTIPILDLNGTYLPRSPHWRYDVAAGLALRQRVLLTSQLDAPLRQLARYLRHERGCSNELSRRRLQDRFPADAAAVQLYRNPELRSVAATVESLTLAWEQPATIAARTGVKDVAVKRYLRYCFDVRDQLYDRAFILEHALRPELRRPPRGRPARRRFLMKAVGYFCGAAALHDLFGLAPATLREQWWGAEQTLWFLSASAQLDDLVRLLDDEESASRFDTDDLQREIEQIAEQVKAHQSKRWPESRLEM